MEKDQIQDMAVEYATEGLSAEHKVVYDMWVISASDADKQVFSDMIDTCAELSIQGLADTAVSGHVKEKILKSVETLGTTAPIVRMIPKEDQEWINLPIRGAKMSELSARKEDGFAMTMIEITAGSEFPEHDHHGVEMAYILEGDLEADGVILHAGDFLRADAGSHHGKHFSPNGCRALIVTANENYHHKTVKALDSVQKVYRKVKNVFAKSS